MRDAKRSGSIINISSILGLRQAGHVAAYAVSKAGLVQLTKVMALELARFDIRVNALAPGYIETDMTKGLSDEVKTKILAQVPLGRIGQVDDVAHAVRFLAGEEAGYITGHVLAVNGGMYM